MIEGCQEYPINTNSRNRRDYQLQMAGNTIHQQDQEHRGSAVVGGSLDESPRLIQFRYPAGDGGVHFTRTGGRFRQVSRQRL